MGLLGACPFLLWITAVALLVGICCGKEGRMSDGHWECPWTMSTSGCKHGTFSCKCPGDGKQVSFQIGCCYEFPRCGKICNSHSCGRYSMCKTCRPRIGESDYNGCLTCKDGFVLGSGDCRTDLDECLTGNGGCEHTCHNTYGSFTCSCNDGYQLLSDGRSCQRLSCGTPTVVPGSSVVPTANWQYGSYAKYSCDDPGHVTVGTEVLKCDGVSSRVFWNTKGKVQCEDTCKVDPDELLDLCGPTGVKVDKCRQLGCCYDSSEALCRHKHIQAYARLSNIKQDKMPPKKLIPWSSVQGCAYYCTHLHPNCKVFSMQQTLNDTEHRIVAAECQLFTISHQNLVASSSLKPSQNHDLYFPLKYIGSGDNYERYRSPMPEKMYLGCFVGTSELEVFAFSDGDDMSGSKCISSCQNRGAALAILRSGFECFCSTGRVIHYNPSAECDELCPGDQNQNCGGISTSAIYKVPKDRRYVGCYSVKNDDWDKWRNFWDATEGKSASDCIGQCARDMFPYARVYDGGACTCGATDSFDHLEAVTETTCSSPCLNNVYQNCGGNQASAIYKTDYGIPVSKIGQSQTLGTLYDDTGAVTAISTLAFTIFPEMHSFISERLILQASRPFLTPIESGFCGESCYSACGAIYHDYVSRQIQGDVTIRAFFFRFSRLNEYVGPDVKRVFIYAQTVLIDQDISVGHALLVRARQIVLDRSTAFNIAVSPGAPTLGVSQEYAREYGPQPETFFLQQSFMCARILFETLDPQNMNTAWAILRDLGKLESPNKEHNAFSGQARALIGELMAMAGRDLHYVPLYTKAHISKILKTYYDAISVYKTDYDRVTDQTANSRDILNYASSMQNIYSQTDVEEASLALKYTMEAIRQTDAAYQRLHMHFRNARTRLDAARDTFLVKLNNAPSPFLKLVGTVVKSLGHIIQGIAKEDYSEARKGIEIFFNESQKIDYTMVELANVVRSIDHMALIAEETVRRISDMSDDFEYDKYLGDLEVIADMQENLVQ